MPWDISHDIASPQNPPTHDNYSLYIGAQGFPYCPVGHCLFFYSHIKKRYGCSRTLCDPHRKHFPSLCLCTLATRNPPALLRHQLVLHLSLSLSSLFYSLFLTTMSLSPCEALTALFPSTTPNTCSHTQSPDLQHIT